MIDSGSASQPLGEGQAAASRDQTLPGALLDPSAGGQSGLLLLDSQGLITNINAEAAAMLRCSLPLLIGRDFWYVVSARLAEQHFAATRSGLASHLQHHFVDHDEFEGSWTEYTFISNPAGCSVSLRDVGKAKQTQRLLRESERRNDLIFNVNPTAMWIFDAASSQIIGVNQAAVEFYGIPRQMFLTLKMGALFPDGEGFALLSALDTRMSPSSSQLTLEVCKQKKLDGEVVLVELACGRIHWKGYKAIFVSLADVTERHLGDRELRREHSEMEEELAKVQAELKKSNRDLQAFTHALSNDLLGPLHSANGFAAVLHEKYAAVLGDVGKRYVHRIQGSIGQLAKLVDDLRVLVQLPQPGQMDVVDVASLCNVKIADLRRHEPDRAVTLELNTQQTLVADKTLLTRALTCLLDNAWKFTARKAEGWIRVALVPGKVPDEVILQVSDNGVGFDEAYADKLFTAFQRLHSSADFPGNGLGLATVKRVAERHNGRVWAETGTTGTSFFMAFPQDDVDTPINITDA
jgi:PAS domain S-box-containing protein